MQVMTERNSDIWLSHFDDGMIWTLGGKVIGETWFLTLPGISYPYYPSDYRVTELRGKLMPGVPVVFAGPDDRVTFFVYPMVVIRRESFTETAERWPSKHIQYRVPAPGAQKIQVQYGQRTLTGYTAYEEKDGAWPYDITYAINLMSGGERAETEAQKLLRHTLRVYPPKAGGGVFVQDSGGEWRSYETFSEGPTDLKEALDIVDRQAGYSVNVRVQGEIDLSDPVVYPSARSLDFDYHSGVN